MSLIHQVIPSARHVGIDDVPLVDNTALGARMRLLQVNADDGLYVLHGFMPAGMTVQTHRHQGAVLAFTLSGSWAYRENDFVNRDRSYLFEPPGSTHTLYVPEDNTEMTELVSAIYGNTEYLDPDGHVEYVSNAQTNLDMYYQYCEEQGVPRPNGILQ